MKTLPRTLSYLLIFLFISFGCNNRQSELSDSDIEATKAEVRDAFKRVTNEVNNHDAEKMMQYCWNSPDYLYVANGTLIKGWESNHKDANTIHSDPKNQSFTIDYDEILIKVLNREAVLLVGNGKFNNINTDEGNKSVNLVVTFLMEKIDNEWLITIGHESTYDKLLIL
jgi:hypothetical protein